MKEELDEKIMKEILALRLKIYNYLTDDDHVGNKAKGLKECVIKQKIKIARGQEFLKNNKTSQQKPC